MLQLDVILLITSCLCPDAQQNGWTCEAPMNFVKLASAYLPAMSQNLL